MKLKRRKVVPTELLFNKWGGLCLNENALKVMLEIGELTDDEVDLLKFVAIAAGHLTNTLKQTMIVICEILTEEPEGGSAMIPFSTFCDLYTFLAKIDCGPPSAHIPDEETPEPEEEEEEEEEELVKTEEKEPTLEAHAEGIIYDIVDTVIAISPGAKQTTEEVTETDAQEEGKQEASPETSENAMDEEQMSDSKEVDMGDEDKAEPPEDTAEDHEENGQVTETNGETGVDNRQGSLEGVDGTPSVKFKIPEKDDNVNTEEDVPVLPEETKSATIGREKSSEKVAKETVTEIVQRAEVAAEANEAEITAAQFLMHVKSETATKKIPKKKPAPKKKPKPSPVHHEVLGIGPPVSDEQIDKVITYLHYWSARQEGMIMPRNINHFLCPPLDAPPPPEFIDPPRPKCVCGVGDPMATECKCALAYDDQPI